mmetsp:Transcript_6485/g.13528  ORF Transcript_6485/g.13528 Transcript_6485/m.13528 type:complete len:652 (-) Transcript_6485:228-2183(-)
MTDTVKVDEEEQRLRERLKAKAQKRREQSHSSRSRSRSRSRSAVRERHTTDPRRSRSGGRSRSPPARQDYHRGGGRDRYHEDRDRRRSYDDWRAGGGRDQHYEDRRGPPSHYRGGPPSNHRDPYYPPEGRGRRDIRQEDRFGRVDDRLDRHGRRRRSRSASRSSSSDGGSSRSGSRGRRHERRRSSRRSRSRSRSLSESSRSSDSESSQSSVESQEENADQGPNLYTKDQRTVFVTQLVQRTTERDLKKYFSKNNLKVNEVILLRDKRTGRHKGCAYIELRQMEDVSKSVALSNMPPSFQRFPILIKASEAEKNYAAGPAPTILTASQMGKPVHREPLIGPNGKLLEAQKVYVGSLDPSVTQEHLFVLFSQFGQLEKVSLQVDTSTGMSKGFAFLSFRDPKEGNLAIQTMGNQVLAGRPLKTGWAVNQIASIPGAEVVTSEEFPADASTRATNAYKVLGQLTMGIPVSQISQLLAASTAGSPTAAAASVNPAVTSGGPPRPRQVPTVAEARSTLAGVGQPTVPAVAAPLHAVTPAVPAPAQTTAGVVAPDPSKIGNSENPTKHVLVHNMFDKDTEEEIGWENEIHQEFEEECSKFGKILKVKVMSKEIGGKIYASFDSIQGAQNCASSLAGRWFDRRQLRVEYVSEESVPA